ncbi:MAG: HDOD domain-containing protein, partial [Proteobacteria bacterium]|nr:HDOD domain-containing protein [Pseudomonadota bacterium]
GVATSSKELANRTNPGIANKIFIPALLHDIGKIIFSVYFKEEYKAVQTFAEEKKKTLQYAENAIFKLDHAILSALLMKRWNFPNSIVLPCRFHHNPYSAPIEFKHHSYIIALADYITQKAGVGLRGSLSPTIPENSLSVLGLSQGKLELIVDQIRKKKDEIQAFFEITMGT